MIFFENTSFFPPKQNFVGTIYKRGVRARMASSQDGNAHKAPDVDSDEEDDDYVPVDDDEDAADDDKFEALAGGEDPDDPGGCARRKCR